VVTVPQERRAAIRPGAIRTTTTPRFWMEPTSMTDFQNRIVGVVGRKGSGKSTRVATLSKYCPRIFAWDPMEDHSDLLPDAFEGVDEELNEYFKQARRAKTFACSFTPVEDLEEEFEEVCRLVYDYGRMLFVVEEAPLVLKAGYMPHAFGRIVRTGRHRQIDLLWTAQRASEVSRTLTSPCLRNL
jgi:hypothetical protein